MVARRLQKSSELSVLAASGTSWWRVLRPLFAVGLVAGITNLALLGWIEPHARYSYRSLMHELKTVAVYQLIKAGQFTAAGKHTIFVNEVDRRSHRFRGIFIFERENDGSTISILAPEGQILRKDDVAVIELYDGTRQRVIPNSNIPENLEFQSMRVPLDGPLMKFRPRGDDEQELSLAEIYAGFSNQPPGISLVDMKTEFHSKLVVILSALFLPMAGLGFALFSGRRERVFALALPVIYIASLFEALQFGDVLIQKYRFWPTAYFWTVFWVYAIVALLLFIWKNDLAAIWGARRWRFRSD
jgi:lipopolysaccharide export system permease protein